MFIELSTSFITLGPEFPGRTTYVDDLVIGIFARRLLIWKEAMDESMQERQRS